MCACGGPHQGGWSGSAGENTGVLLNFGVPEVVERVSRLCHTEETFQRKSAWKFNVTS